MSVFWVQTGTSLVAKSSITPEEFHLVEKIEKHIFDEDGEHIEITILQPKISPSAEKVKRG